SLTLALLCALLMLIGTLLHMGLALTVFGFFLLVGCLGVAWVNTDSLIIIEFPQHAGSASAVVGTLRFGVGALAGPILTWTYSGTPVPVAVIIFVLLLGTALLQAARHFSSNQS
ncbi:MAG: Bcr/CflA family drug resistance efflux transporter, partial [Pseudomonadota bacterium]